LWSHSKHIQYGVSITHPPIQLDNISIQLEQFPPFWHATCYALA